MKEKNNGALRFIGIVMIIFGIVYAILGTLSLLEEITGIFPGHEKQEIIIVILSYITLLVSIIGGVTAIKGNLKFAKILAIIFSIIGIISLIYTLITQKMFNNFDCITIVIGLGIIILAILEEKENEKIRKMKEKKDNSNIRKKEVKKSIPHKKKETSKVKNENKKEVKESTKTKNKTRKK